ncbi:hypothetical protein OH77DRAFT_1300055 [Trametes cingulata]|nr:hypothetical protein OH77DRAFT_1300055 [Trametes cingulata]
MLNSESSAACEGRKDVIIHVPLSARRLALLDSESALPALADKSMPEHPAAMLAYSHPRSRRKGRVAVFRPCEYKDRAEKHLIEPCAPKKSRQGVGRSRHHPNRVSQLCSLVGRYGYKRWPSRAVMAQRSNIEHGSGSCRRHLVNPGASGRWIHCSTLQTHIHLLPGSCTVRSAARRHAELPKTAETAVGRRNMRACLSSAGLLLGLGRSAGEVLRQMNSLSGTGSELNLVFLCCSAQGGAQRPLE